MVVWLSCYAWVPVVVLMAYDKAQRIYKNCCKKKKTNNNIKENNTKEEKDSFKLNKDNKKIIDNSKEKSEWIFYDPELNKEKNQ